MLRYGYFVLLLALFWSLANAEEMPTAVYTFAPMVRPDNNGNNSPYFDDSQMPTREETDVYPVTQRPKLEDDLKLSSQSSLPPEAKKGLIQNISFSGSWVPDLGNNGFAMSEAKASVTIAFPGGEIVFSFDAEFRLHECPMGRAAKISVVALHRRTERRLDEAGQRTVDIDGKRHAALGERRASNAGRRSLSPHGWNDLDAEPAMESHVRRDLPRPERHRGFAVRWPGLDPERRLAIRTDGTASPNFKAIEHQHFGVSALGVCRRRVRRRHLGRRKRQSPIGRRHVSRIFRRTGVRMRQD